MSNSITPPKFQVNATQGGNKDKTAKQKEDSMKLVRTLGIIFVVFVGCWTPHISLIVRTQ